MRWFQPQSYLVSLAFVLALAPQVDAASLTVAWDPPSDNNTAGYKVFYGTSPGVYTKEVDAGFVTQRVVDGLAEGVTYYFAVQAYSITGVLSDLSAFAEATTPTSGGSTRKGKGGPGRDKPSKGKPTATITEDSYIDIEWVPEADDTSSDSPTVAADTANAQAVSIGYRVEVGTVPGDTSYSAVTGEHSVRFDMADLPAETYFIRVRPFAGTTYRPVSEEVNVSPDRPVPPGAPVNPSAAGRCGGAPKAPRQLNANARGAAVSLEWKRGPGDAPASFLLQVGTQPGLEDVLITQFAGNVYGVSAMAANAAYALRLSALNDCGSSLWAPETMLYVGVEPLPGMPQALTQTVSDGLVTLAWEPPPSGGPVTRYLIEAMTAFGPFVYDTGTQATGFSHANTPPGQYVVTVRAGNATGFGVASPPVVVVVP
jgi:Fibronectin type III domain